MTSSLLPNPISRYTITTTRLVPTQKLRRIVDESVAFGLALEGISAADVARLRAR
jgi:hypothetical protein